MNASLRLKVLPASMRSNHVYGKRGGTRVVAVPLPRNGSGLERVLTVLDMHTGQALTRAEIAAAAGLTLQPARNLIENLIMRGLVKWRTRDEDGITVYFAAPTLKVAP